MDSSPEEVTPRLCEILAGQLYLSSMFLARNLEVVRSHEITHVLCVAEEALGKDERHPLAKTAPDIVIADFDGVELDDLGGSHLTEVLPRHIGFIDDALCNASGRCLVHCRLGVNRSAAVVISYLMARRGMIYEEAHAHVMQRSPGISVHPEYERELLSLPPGWCRVGTQQNTGSWKCFSCMRHYLRS